ncbi:MAG: hypothetical protein MRJ92_08100 [Nitrospira sp.]|nr:hypothetical protein [Nitrospira sp.]
MGQELIASEPYKEGDNDFRAVIGKLKAEDLKQYGVEVQVDNDPAKTGIRQGGKKGKRCIPQGSMRFLSPDDAGCGTAGRSIGVLRYRGAPSPGPTDGTNLTLRASPIEASREGSLSTDFFAEQQPCRAGICGTLSQAISGHALAVCRSRL